MDQFTVFCIVLLLLLLIVWVILTFKTSTKSYTSYEEDNNTLNLYYKDDLYWTNVDINGSSIPMILDTGSKMVLVRKPECLNCNPVPGLTSSQQIRYTGGQVVDVYPSIVNSSTFNQTITVSVVVDGQNNGEPIDDVLGLLNSSLGIKNMTLNLAANKVTFNVPMYQSQNTHTFAPITLTTSINAQGTAINNGAAQYVTIIIDSGTNYILVPADYQGLTQLQLAGQIIDVPSNLIRTANIDRDTIILGNLLMIKYQWNFDLEHKLMSIQNNKIKS